MLNAGTIKKRARRTLVKVNGLGVLPYDEAEDNFNVKSLFEASTSTKKHGIFVPGKSVSRIDRRSSGSHTTIAMSATVNLERLQSRVTRDPLFHMEEGRPTTGSDDEFEDYYEGSRPQTGGTLIAAQDRPYLLNKAAIYIIRAIVFVGMMIGSFPWKWNSRTHRVDRWSPAMVSFWKFFTIASGIQSFCIMSYHFYFFVGMFYQDLESFRGVFAYFFYIYWYAFSISYKISTYIYQDEIREYINTLFGFNKVFVEKYVIYVDPISDRPTGQMVLRMAIPAAFSQILNLLSFYLVMPYRPEYFTSRLLPMPWYCLIPGAVQDVCMSGHLIIIYTVTAWIIVAHTNSVEFWLREIHKGNESGFTKNTMRNSKVALETYRSLQILNTLFNDCCAPNLIPNMKGVVFLGIIACGVMFIRSIGQVFINEFPRSLAYPFGSFNASVIGFGCLSMGAEMYDIANSFINSWSRTKQKDFRRMLMSCPSLKMRVARFYFVTTATTITFFKVIMDYVTDCIISFPA